MLKLCASLCILSLALTVAGGPGFAKSGDMIDDAVVLCGAWLMQPDKFDAEVKLRGYDKGPGGNLGRSWEAQSYSRDGRYLTMFEINYIDAKSKTCTATSAVAGTIADFEELRARLADDPVLGRFSGEVGTPPGAGKIVLSTFKRAGANPFVLLSGTSTASFVTITLTRTDFSKAN